MSNSVVEALRALLKEAEDKEAQRLNVTPQPTGRYFFTDMCQLCLGTGRIKPVVNTGKWMISYQYRDCHETSREMTKEQAIESYLNHTDKSCNQTLIGPDGQIYTLKR